MNKTNHRGLPFALGALFFCAQARAQNNSQERCYSGKVSYNWAWTLSEKEHITTATPLTKDEDASVCVPNGAAPGGVFYSDPTRKRLWIPASAFQSRDIGLQPDHVEIVENGIEAFSLNLRRNVDDCLNKHQNCGKKATMKVSDDPSKRNSGPSEKLPFNVGKPPFDAFVVVKGVADTIQKTTCFREASDERELCSVLADGKISGISYRRSKWSDPRSRFVPYPKLLTKFVEPPAAELILARALGIGPSFSLHACIKGPDSQLKILSFLAYDDLEAVFGKLEEIIAEDSPASPQKQNSLLLDMHGQAEALGKS